MKIRNLKTNENRFIDTKFVFIGAGGAALPLLQKTDVHEADGFGGFPVSGQWLICKNPELVALHSVKVYGKSSGSRSRRAHQTTRALANAGVVGPRWAWWVVTPPTPR